MYISEEYLKEGFETFAHKATQVALGAAGLSKRSGSMVRRAKKSVPIMQKTQGKMEMKAKEALKAGDKKLAKKYTKASKNLQKKQKKLTRGKRSVNIRRGGAATVGFGATAGQGGQQ